MKLENLLSAMTAKLVGKRVMPAAPQGRVSRVGHADPDDEIEVEAKGDNVTALFIRYVDSKGQTSERRIVCKAYEDDKRCILAYCLERRAARRFKVDRIAEAVSIDTGEVFDSELLVIILRDGLPVHDERLRRIMTVLTFLMRCDKEAHAFEMDVLEEAATSFAIRFDGNDETIRQGLQFARSAAPDGDDFVRALRWIAKREDRAQITRLLAPMAEKVIVADGVIKSEEAYYGGLLRDVLAEMA